MMLIDFMNSDDARVKTVDFDDDSDTRQHNRGVGKHPLLDTSDSQSTESPAKRMRSSPQRISCKARGLSNRHNADNAYLEIPPGAPHGLPLRCSDPECASSGRRFRYCQVCGVPVAKRNFLQRHGHGMVSTATQLRNDVDNHCQPCASSGATPLASDVNVIGEMRGGIRIENAGHRRDVSFDGPSHDGPLDFREKTWLNLLHVRPNINDPTHMTNWLKRVVSFSEHDLETSRDAHTQIFPSTISCFDDIVHVPRLSTRFQSVYEAGISVAAMKRPIIGLFTQASTSSLGTGFGQTTQESANVASEIAEFDDFMDGIDTSLVFV
ncbi:hypothetical protein MHU86_5050 [Fragilaria crotonensis]|nr:hypothetical protein MHU86_5050 [Fragilaria crotonensis]